MNLGERGRGGGLRDIGAHAAMPIPLWWLASGKFAFGPIRTGSAAAAFSVRGRLQK